MVDCQPGAVGKVWLEESSQDFEGASRVVVNGLEMVEQYLTL